MNKPRPEQPLPIRLTHWINVPLLVSNKGYGIFYYEGRQWRAHRLLWKWEYFKIPDDLCIDHLCKNKRCIVAPETERVR